MPKMTEPATPHVRRPAQARKPQAMTARVASAVAIGPVRVDTRVVKVDWTGASVPADCAKAGKLESVETIAPIATTPANL